MDQTRRWLSTAVNWTQYSTELLSIHYEDLRKDPRPQLRLILAFLQLPVDEIRLDCIEVTYIYSRVQIEMHNIISRINRNEQKYPPKKFHRKNRFDEELDENAIFPERMRHVLDRAIRYVDYLTQQTGNRGLPLDSYSYYNQSSWKGSQPARTVPNQTWIEWISDQWGFRVESLLKDPLTQMLRDEAEANIFYTWNIPFASTFNESKELERDFNSGPPLFIQQFRHAKFPPK